MGHEIRHTFVCDICGKKCEADGKWNASEKRFSVDIPKSFSFIRGSYVCGGHAIQVWDDGCWRSMTE